MSVSAISAAKFLCKESGWSLTNLQLQKILYLAHMIYMGRYQGRKLINEDFEAWDYGPVIPELYHLVKIFGSDPIKNIFRGYDDIPDGEEKDILKEALENLQNVPASRLVSATHRKGGAWRRAYESGIKSGILSDEDIYAEYRSMVQ